MLYQVYDMQRAALSPLRAAAGLTQQVFRHPLVPASYTAFGRAMAAGAELLERTTRRFGKPGWGLETTHVAGRDVAVTERIVARTPFCDLIHFERATPHRDPKLLVVAPMSGHHATLLRGTVEALLPDHDVYVTDWIDARLVPLSEGAFDLDDYIAHVIDFLRLLGPDCHVMAVCQPVVPVLAAVSLMAAEDDPARPRSMTLMGGPVDTRAAPTVVTRLAEERPLSWFERTVIARVPVWHPGAMRAVYPGFVQLSGFMSMNLDRHIGEHFKLFQHLVQGDGDSAEAHRRFYDEYLSVMDLPAEFYLQTVETVFQKHALPKGEMIWRDRRVDPGAIRDVAMMTVEGELDDISAPGQTRAAHDLCANLPQDLQEDWMQPGVGHYGIFNGRRWRESILPRVRGFIRRHDRRGVRGAAA